MSADYPAKTVSLQATPITRDNLNVYLKSLGKEFRKLNGTKTPAEIILIGGAAVLANYGFRELTYDVDAIIRASSAMKEAITRVGDNFGLPYGWLNADFTRTTSFSDKLYEKSVYYKTYSNILQVRIISAEYLIAMKLMSGRRYKNDMSDVCGILWEHQQNKSPISKITIEQAVTELYGNMSKLPEKSVQLLEKAFSGGNLEALYNQSRENEKESKEILVEFEKKYPHTLKTENIDAIIEQMELKRDTAAKPSLLGKLEKAKQEVETKRKDAPPRKKKISEID
jgi:hypothetical protein